MRPQSELETSLTHTLIAVFSLIGLIAGSLAIGLMVYDGNTTTVTVGSDVAASNEPAINFGAKPDEGWTPYDPALAPAPGGTEHKIELRATEQVLEVAPGLEQEMWTFNDLVPGPVLRGRVGDLFTITLVNEGKLGHSIDFHASKVAWNDEMRTIESGESLVYQFEAKHAGVFMYHCGTAPALHHIGNGMFGAIVIDPPVLAPVDHEFVLVQSELYPGPEGQPGDLAAMQSEDHAAVVFNGYKQTWTGPVGDTARAPSSGHEKFAGALLFTMNVDSARMGWANGADYVLLVAPGGEKVQCITWGEIKAPEGMHVYSCALGGENGTTLMLPCAPSFADFERKPVTEAELWVHEVSVPRGDSRP